MQFIKFSLIQILIILCFLQSFAGSLTDRVVEETGEINKIGKENDEVKNLPLWELGVASISSWAHDYPGANQGKFTPLIVPSIVYRGDFLRSDVNGARALFVNNKKLEFSMSLGGNFPVKSEDNKAREGMDTLGQIFQAGPRLLYYVKNTKNIKVYFDIAARTGFAIGTEWRAWRGVGFTGDIGINYRHRFGNNEIFVLFFTSAATYELHKYFYDVREKDVTATRAAYHSRSGYLGTNLLVGYAKDFSRRFSIFAGAGLSFLEGHVNDRSPLFKKDINARAVLGLKYTLLYSKKKISE